MTLSDTPLIIIALGGAVLGFLGVLAHLLLGFGGKFIYACQTRDWENALMAGGVFLIFTCLPIVLVVGSAYSTGA